MKKKSLGTIMIISVLVLIAISGFVYVYSMYGNIKDLKANIKIVDVPIINTHVVSKDDGESHALTVKFSLGIDNSVGDANIDNIDTENLQLQIESILSTIDYTKLIQKDGLSYLKDEIKANLNIDEKYLDYIYITDIQSGGFKNPNVDKKFKNSKQESVFKSLFPNMK